MAKKDEGKDVVVGRVDKEHLMLLKHTTAEAQKADAILKKNLAIHQMTMALIAEKFGLPDNANIDMQTGDVTIREKSPGGEKAPDRLDAPVPLFPPSGAPKKDEPKDSE